MGLLENLYRQISTSRLRKIDAFASRPFEIQEQQLQFLVTSAASTQYLGRFLSRSSSSYSDFAQSLPITTYDDLHSYVERIRGGEQNLLWNGAVKWMARSSGTTAAKSKFIPITTDSLRYCHHRANTDVLALYLHQNPQSKLLSGKTLILGGSRQLDSKEGLLTVGDLSAILISTTPSALSFFKEPSPSIALIPDFELKVKRICESAVRRNITAFAGVPSWNLVLMRHILSYSNRNSLLDLWPNLEAFIHGGISFTPYREQFRSIIPSDSMNYMETYNASEGFFALQDSPHRKDMMLMLDYQIFYEFLPVASLNDPTTAVPLEGVQEGVNYALLISTSGGLWRYMIGDTVMFTSRNPYRLIITGRTKQYINAFGEEVIVDNAESALTAACRVTGATVSEYTVAPLFMEGDSKGAHQWIIEFVTPPSDSELFISQLDTALQSVNSDYEAKRFRSATLDKPRLVSVPQGTFYRWMKQLDKLGGQNKVPRLANTRQYADQIIDLLRES